MNWIRYALILSVSFLVSLSKNHTKVKTTQLPTSGLSRFSPGWYSRRSISGEAGLGLTSGDGDFCSSTSTCFSWTSHAASSSLAARWTSLLHRTIQCHTMQHNTMKYNHLVVCQAEWCTRIILLFLIHSHSYFCALSTVTKLLDSQSNSAFQLGL